MKTALFPLDAGRYAQHPVHGDERSWTESNCYVDLWIETIHGMGLDPVAAMPFTLAIDFEGDQWTFFKYPLEDLYAVYGLDVKEMNVWRPLAHHIEEQLRMGRLMIVEVDSYFLPDTAGVSYQLEHTKTSIAVQEIDLEARRIGYFHGRGYYLVEGDDFEGLLRIGMPAVWPAALPPYVELVRLDGRPPLTEPALTAKVLELTRLHVARRPLDNPVQRFRYRFLADLEWLRSQELSVFHGYAFGTLRQLGACSELAGTFLQWLADRGEAGLEPAIAGSEVIARTAKVMQFKMARAVNGKKPVDFAPMLDEMASAWDETSAALLHRFSS